MGLEPARRSRRRPADVTAGRSGEGAADRELLAATAGGDREAFRRLFDRHAGRVLSVLRRLVGDPAVAEDLLQEVFLRVWRKAVSFDERRGDFGGWLFVLCRNHAADHFRRRRPPTVEAREGDAVVEPSRELRLAVAQSIGALRPEERAVLEETYFSGRTYEEAAARLGVPLGTLKSRLRTALKKLSGRLAPP